ncbi:MAG TPA: phosphopantetheinyl transferase [Rhodobacteraceae bacterium]|nr:phosphopantetheinyl transferase [Paracoccaceae bacterium]
MLETAFHTTEETFQGLVDVAPGRPVAVAVTDPRAEYPGAFPTELAEMPRAVESRRREYVAGRVAAHRAMEKLGLSARPVLSNRSRAPSWPRGLTGSLSHNDTTCIAAVARSSQVKSLGVDVEDESPLAPDLVATICTLEERAWLATQPEAARGGLAKLIFCAKEAVYKCQFPVSHRLLDFDAVLVTPDVDTGQFEATFLVDTGPFRVNHRLNGRFAVAGGLIHTAVVLPSGMAPS